MKEDNISQLGNYGTPFCEQYTHGSCSWVLFLFMVSLFKFKSFDQFNTHKTASNFRLSCGTIVSSRGQEKSDLQNKTEPLEKAEQFDKVKPANTDLTIESRILPCLHIGGFVPPPHGGNKCRGTKH